MIYLRWGLVLYKLIAIKLNAQNGNL